MQKGRWKKRLLCVTLSLAMMSGVIMDIPNGATVMAAESAENIEQTIEGFEAVAVDTERETCLSPEPGRVTYRSLISHDYDEIKAALESNDNYHIRLDGDVAKDVAYVTKGRDETSNSLLMAGEILADAVTAGMMEIIFEGNHWAWRPIEHGGAPEYLCVLGSGYKVLELDGHNFHISNPEFQHRRTLFQVNEGTNFTIKDDKDKGEVFYNGYIFAAEDSCYFKEKMGGDMQRDIIEVNGGSFTLNGGTLCAGRSKNESGFTLFTAKKLRSGTDHYTGSATKYVNGTAVRMKSGEVTINKGTLYGRGYEDITNNIYGTHVRNAVIEATSGTLTINDAYIKAKGGADCLQVDKNVVTSVHMGKFSLHRNDALFCGNRYGFDDGDHYYSIDDSQPFGFVGIPTDAIPAQTWVEYNTGYHNETKMLGSSHWKEDFKDDVELHRGKDDYEPWLCIYPDGGWGTLTAVANPDPEIPELNPIKKGQMYFEYNLVSAFDFISEEVRRASGWKREYEFMIYDKNGTQRGLKGYKTGMSMKYSFGKEDYNQNYTWEYLPTEYDWGKGFRIGETYNVVCIMTETYYGSRTYTATTIAGRQFVAKDIQAPMIADGINFQEGHIKLDKKGDQATISTNAKYATQAKWYRKTKTGDTFEMPEEEYTIEFSEFQGIPFLDTTLTTKVNEEATYYCVFSNTVGSVTYKCDVTFPVSFVYKETTSATIYKSVGGEISAPIEGTLEDGMYFKWYYWWENVNNLTGVAFTPNRNKLKIPANANMQSNNNYFMCEICDKDGKTVADSPWISVEYVTTDELPDRNIVGLVIGGLDDKMYVGQKAPTADQIYIKDDTAVNGIDPRIRVKNVTMTGVNSDGIITSRNPSITMQFETTADYFCFESKKDYDRFGDTWYMFYQAGPYIWGWVTGNSHYQRYMNVTINFDGTNGHYALQEVPDTVIAGRTEFVFEKGKYVDIPLNFELDMSGYAKSLGRTNYISSIVRDPAFSTVSPWPNGLSLVQTGSCVNASGKTEPTYSLRGTPQNEATDKQSFFYVYVMGDPEYPNGRAYGISFQYSVVPAGTMTEEEAMEASMQDAQEKATAHVHEMLAWYPTDSSLDKYTRVHQRVCRYYDSDVDGNGIDLCGGCYYMEEEPHDFYDLEILTEATATQPGTKRCRCAVCGLELEREYSLNPEGHVVTLDLNLGEGYSNQTKDIDVPDGEFPLPIIAFAHPDGKIFGGWELDGTIYKVDEKISVNKDLTLKVRWVAELLDNGSPKLIGASASETDVTVKWRANPGVLKYAIFRKEAGGKWGKIGETTGSGNENEKANAYSECKFVDETAKPGVSYFYTVRGINKAGKYVTSYNTVGVGAQINAQLPVLDKSSPKLLTAAGQEDGIQVYWTANSGVFQYAIFRKVSGGKWTKISSTTGTGDESASAPAGAGCTYLDKTAQPGVRYIYTVRGIDGNGKYVTSFDATGVSGSMDSEPIDESSPKLLGASSEENGIEVTWTANSGVYKYAVFRKPKGGKWGKLFETTGTGSESVRATAGSTCYYVDGTAEDGKTYYYTVRGVDKNSKYVTSYDETGVSATYVDTHVKPAFSLSKDSNPAKGGTIMIDMTAFELLIVTDDDWMLAYLEDEISYAWYADGAVIASQTGTSITVTDALSGKTVYAVASITGKTLTTNSIKIESFASELDASSPKLIGATSVNGGMNVTWTANGGVTWYAIFRKSEDGKYGKIGVTTGSGDESAAAMAGSTCGFVDTTAEDGMTYTYTVRGIDGNGKYITSYDAKGVSATMANPPENLDAGSPVLIGATATANGITVTWKANSGVFRYQVFRKVKGGKWGKLEVTTGSGNESVKAATGSTCSYEDKTADAGVTYYYSVRGVDADGNYVTTSDTTGVSCTK